MSQSFLVFDFGSDEEAAQKARHTIDRWKQGFRLDKKMLLKFDRKDEGTPKQEDARPGNGNILLLVRLDFSDHEKLSHQRWVERIPNELPFKDARPKVIHAGDAQFGPIAELFDSLE